jgi:CHASE3 domain sensor protein
MKIFAGMSVAQRLAVGFGLVAALLATVCAVGIGNAWQSQRLIEEALGPAQVRFNAAAELLSQVQRQDVAIRNNGLFSDPEAMQRQAALIKTLDAQVLGTLQQLAASAVDPQDRSDIETVQTIAK